MLAHYLSMSELEYSHTRMQCMQKWLHFDAFSLLQIVMFFKDGIHNATVVKSDISAHAEIRTVPIELNTDTAISSFAFR